MVTSRIGDLELQGTDGALALAGLLLAISAVKLGAWGGLVGALLIIASLVVHEIGHLAMAQALGVRVRAIGICFKGAYLRRAKASQCWSELLIAVSGPAASLLLYAWFRDGDAIFHWVALLNLVLAISNLVPLPGSDGHRILACLSAGRTSS